MLPALALLFLSALKWPGIAVVAATQRQNTRKKKLFQNEKKTVRYPEAGRHLQVLVVDSCPSFK